MTKKLSVIRPAVVILLVLAILFSGLGTTPVPVVALSPTPWSFGVMGDTQWTPASDPAGTNPGAVSASVISQLNTQFINKGVKFVIQVGDLINGMGTGDVAARATAAQALYTAGIGFFPMRGNHEVYNDPTNFTVAAMQTNFPQTQGISNTFGATGFNSPTTVSTDLNGLSYSFNYGDPGNNATFVILDVMATPSKNATIPPASYKNGYTIADQQAWISSQLDKSTRGTEQAFVFSHSNLIGENHYETVFTGYADSNIADQNAFMANLQGNDVKYFISGHEHLNERSIITSPDGNSSVEQLICASAGPKFINPKPSTDAGWHGQKTRQTVLSQELNTIGYYIYTVDGSRVTVDYYSDDQGNWKSDASWPSGPTGAGTLLTPTFNFVKKATWGYDLNGTTNQKAKNIIVMVSDGMGYNAMLAGDYYQRGETGDQVYQNFPVQVAASTYEYESVSDPYPYPIPPYASQNPAYRLLGYDTNLAWSDFNYASWMDMTPHPEFIPAGFWPFYHNNSTDSSSSATAMASGVKTKDGYVGVDINQIPVKNIAEYAEDLGKATGVVTSVPLSHATPVGWSVHNVSRDNYAALASQMIYSSALDVIMGCGAPDYSKDGLAVIGPYTESASKYVGGVATWTDITGPGASVTGADANRDGMADNWSVIRTKAEFQAMATATTSTRVLGIPQVNQSLQFYRSGDAMANPGVVPLISTVPSLADMSKAALNVLNNNPNGFFVMIEGGAVDWAGHFLQPGRLIEEQIDFNNAVQAVSQWVETHSSWDETLLIVTADHETGYVWGPGSGAPATWNPVVNNGAGVMPGFIFSPTGWHTNSLVPVFAKGPGASLFNTYADENDTVRGPYIDNTEYMKVFISAFDIVPSSQTWNLDSETNSAGLFKMEQTPPSTPFDQSGLFTLANQQTLLWVSDQQASMPVVFDCGVWEVHLNTTQNWGSGCLIEIGYWDGSFHKFTGSQPYQLSYQTPYIIKAQILFNSVEVPKDAYLSLQITNQSGAEQTINTGIGKTSFLMAPSSQPGFPVPELAAGVLLAIGLLALALFVIIRRRNSESVNASYNLT